MESTDTILLSSMREAIDAYRANTLGVGDLAEKLLALRDGLQFRDASWAHEATQQIATLDSASTFVPKNDEQAKQSSRAVDFAIASLLRLIGEKLM